MAEDLYNIDDLFHSALEGHEEAPPPRVWEGLDNNLDKKNVVSINRKYTHLKRVAAVLLLFAFAAGVYALYIRMNNREIVKKYKEHIQNEKKFTPKNERPNEVASNKHDSVKQLNADKENKAVNETIGTENNTTKNATEHPMPVLIEKRTSRFNNKEVNPSVLHQNLSNNNAIKNDEGVPVERTGNKTEPDAVVNHQHKGVQQQYVNNSHAMSGSLLSSKNDLSPKNNIEVQKEAVQRLMVTPIDPDKLLQSTAFKNINLADVNNSSGSAKKLLRRSPFSVSVFFSPELASNRIGNEPSAPPGRGRDEFKKKEQYASSINTGVLFGYNISNNWTLQSGLSFSSSTIDIAPKTIYAEPDNFGRVRYRFNCSSGYSYISPKQGNIPAVGDTITAVASKNTLQYLIVPLSAKYNITKGKFTFGPSAGIAANILLKGKIATTIGNNAADLKSESNSVDGLKPTYFSGIISFGADYKLGKNISVGIAPTARLALTSINQQAPVQSYPKAFGLAGGVHISF